MDPFFTCQKHAIFDSVISKATTAQGINYKKNQYNEEIEENTTTASIFPSFIRKDLISVVDMKEKALAMVCSIPAGNDDKVSSGSMKDEIIMCFLIHIAKAYLHNFFFHTIRAMESWTNYLLLEDTCVIKN